VALASAVQGAPLAACLLEQDLVLWRDDAGQVQAFADRCPHRGARCRWAGARGPAGMPLPRLALRSRRALRAGAGAARFHATGLALCQHLRLQRGARPGLGAIGARRRGQGLPPFAAEDDAGLRKVNCGPYDVAASAPRIIENFLDMAHFGFVHEAGWAARARDRRLRGAGHRARLRATGCKAWQPQSNLHSTAPAQVEYTYEVTAPTARC
jgi:phenylpropionate dioxygenase-like ring-hydroxylating dioxygenase large terminal subunit